MGENLGVTPARFILFTPTGWQDLHRGGRIVEFIREKIRRAVAQGKHPLNAQMARNLFGMLDELKTVSPALVRLFHI